MNSENWLRASNYRAHSCMLPKFKVIRDEWKIDVNKYCKKKKKTTAKVRELF